MEKIQLRGHCQHCGRLQAVPRGRMSKHGYEIRGEQYGGYRYFSGVCQGERYEPMEVSIEESLRIVEAVRAQSVKLLARAAALRAGEIFPLEAKSGKRIKIEVKWNEYPWKEEMVPFAEAPAHHKEEAVKSAAWQAESHGEGAQNFAEMLEKLAQACIGKPLLEVAKEAGPAPIQIGERKAAGNFGICVVYSVNGAKVYYRSESKLSASGKPWASQMSSRSWRALPAV